MAVNKLISFFKSVDVSLPVFSLTILFGLGSWLTINGVWVELPTIVPFVPEQWKLSSYLSLIGQLSNIGPVFVLVLNKARPRWLKETAVTYAIIIVGVTSCVMSAFLWQTTSLVGGDEHSVALFIFVFLMSLCDYNWFYRRTVKPSEFATLHEEFVRKQKLKWPIQLAFILRHAPSKFFCKANLFMYINVNISSQYWLDGISVHHGCLLQYSCVCNTLYNLICSLNTYTMYMWYKYSTCIPFNRIK